MTLLRVNEYFVMRIVTKHNQRQEYYNKAALLNTYKSLYNRVKELNYALFLPFTTIQIRNGPR